MDKSKNAYVMISDDIYALRQLLNSIYFIQEYEIAEKFEEKINDLEKRFTEKLHVEQNQISYGDFDDIIAQTVELKYEINDYIQGEGKKKENKKLLEKYTLRLTEFSKKFSQIKSSELWIETQEIIEELKRDCEKNPLLEFERFEKAIAKNVLQILIKQAKDGEKIDIVKAQDFCSQFDLISIIHNRLIEMCNEAENLQEKSKILVIASKLNENSLEDVEIWKLLAGADSVQIVLPERKKIENWLANLPKLLGLSVYILADINPNTGEWVNVKKVYGRYPKKFSPRDEERVVSVEINGVEKLDRKDMYDIQRVIIAPYPNLQRLILSDDVKEIGIHVFAEHKKLNHVELGRGIKEIPNYCFYNCESLKNIELPDNIRRIGDSAFGKSGMESIDIPGTVENIAYGAFKQCKKLKNIELNRGLRSIGPSAFEATGIEEIYIPSTVKEICGEAFAKCHYLRKINNLREQNIEVRNGAFKDCRYKKELHRKLGLSIYTFGFYSVFFKEWIGLWEYYAPFPMSKDSMAWKDTSTIIKLEIHGVDEVKKEDFSDFENLQEITFDDTLKKIGEDAFPCCKNLKRVNIESDGAERIIWSSSKRTSHTEIKLPDSFHFDKKEKMVEEKSAKKRNKKKSSKEEIETEK